MIELVLLALAVLALAFTILYRAYSEIRSDYKELLSKKQSLSVKYGKMSEQFIPLLQIYPYDEQNFRFIGSPVDGVQFNDDGIVFVEFKAANSQLSSGQKHIRKLVGEGKVKFEEIRIGNPD
jgi:predicted Holliday junction resolvase-like endonuclease